MKQILTIPVYFNTTESNMVTKSVTIISPLNSSRIGRVWVNRAEPSLYIPFGAKISMDVNANEILPKNYPLRWLCADHYICNLDYNPNKLRIPSDRFAVEIDEPAFGNEITFNVTCDTDLILSIECDDLPIKPFKTRYKVLTIQPYNISFAVQGQYFGLETAMEMVGQIELPSPAIAVFGDFDIDFPRASYPFLDVNMPLGSGATEHLYIDRKIDHSSFPSDNMYLWPVGELLDLSSWKKQRLALNELFGASTISLSEGSKKILDKIDTSLIAPTSLISPDKSKIMVIADNKYYNVKLISPVIITESELYSTPYESSVYHMCFLYKYQR